ncbi:hypothetical protein [Tropicibacter oceani]|uniref:D-galactarate dehydratase n=1 Tax=Tropicibacter oceani TaxID=3058420 RepID=A0ABY8QD41_9RHOB|nr:hypothetical protein [Tropicibacter oceani]WGW02539.1 hypothetical protein QF118_11340 [Tropicibacter oceani]
MKAALITFMAFGLSACGNGIFAAKPVSQTPPVAVSDDQPRPQSRPETLSAAPKPPANARTVEDFDTTTAEERQQAAAAPEPVGERKLGETVASLGDVSKPGFWLETPLVSAATKGRILYPGSGKSAQVDLIPIDGPATAGSRISLAAMRLIEAPLTDLPTIEVYAGG